jgi:hypothetical protein
MKMLIAGVSFALSATLAGGQAFAQAPGVVPQPDTKLPRTHAPRPTVADITPQDLMTRLYIFADDSMQGREAGTIGNVKGTDYIAAEARRIGLTPAGDGGGWFQTIPLEVRTPDPSSRFTIAGAPLAWDSEWVGAGASYANPNADVIYGGNLGDSASLVTPAQAAGKFVVFSIPPGNAARRFIRSATRFAPTAAAVGVALSAQLMSYVIAPQTFLDDPPPGALAARAALYLTPAGVEKLFGAPLGRLAPGAAGKSAAIDLKVTTVPTPYPARNVVGILRGTDPALRGEYVAIGAHSDHIGFNHTPVDHDSLRIFNHIVRPDGAENAGAVATPEQQAEANKELAAFRAAHPGSQRLDSIANGADDDGSGTVTVLEIAQKLASLRGAAAPKRSILFVWHVGEEKGLLGSTYFTDHPTVPRDSIVAQLNMDQVGRGDAWDASGIAKDGALIHGNPNQLYLVGSRRLSTELGDLAERVNVQGKHALVFDYAMDANGHPTNVYCRSDHYEYARYGIPIIFFTTGIHSDYHQVTDEPQYIDYDHMARVARLIEDVAIHVANLDHRVVVDHPKPDPHGACQQ